MSTRDEEFSLFFAEQADRLRRLAFFLTGDLEHAADLAQDALAATYRNWSKIRGDDPAPYARRALVNRCRNAKRRRFLERKHATASDTSISYEGRFEETQRVAHALRVLSPVQRAAVVLRYYEDLTEADIADVVGRPLGTVKSDLFRALQKLRPLLDERDVS